MGQRRFGPTKGAGVAIIEKESQKQIEPADLGTTAYTGVMQKGPTGKAFLALNRTQYDFKAGARIPDSLLPDAALDFYREGQGAGALWLNRITAGNEKASTLEMKNRRDPKSKTLTWEAGNGGRWGGKKQKPVDEYASLTATTLTLSNPPAGLKNDELAGGSLTLSAVPGKSFEILSNTEGGVLQLPSDVDLVAEVGASADTLVSVELENDGLALGVLIKNGLDNPTTEWGLEIYLVEGGISTLARNYDNLSSDPSSPNYFVPAINDDPNADFLLKVTDDFTGSVTADIRPANVFGKSLTLTNTVLTAKIHDTFVSSADGALAQLRAPTLEGSVIEDEILLTNTIAGARATEVYTPVGNPSDGETVTINGKVITFRTVPTVPDDEVLIGGDEETTIDNLVAFINAATPASNPLLYLVVFAEKASATTMDLFAQPGLAGNSIAVSATAGAWGGGTLSGGLDQIWSYASEKMPFLTGLTVTTNLAFAVPNQFGFGFVLKDTSQDSSKNFAVDDTVTIVVCPLELGKLVDGALIPNTTERRIRFNIVSNTANTITVQTGSQMIDDAATGDDFRVEYIKELRAGYDGLADIIDQNFIDGYDASTSPLKGLRGRNLGLVKLASPGVISTAIQKSGVAFAGSENWQYRYEIPSNITDEQAAEEFINDTLGRNDFAVVTWPSFVKIRNPLAAGNKLISATGMIHGEEALIAKNFDGFHKAAAGTNAILATVIALPDGMEDKTLDEEFLNPIGINIIKRKEGNFIMWGDRTVGLDPAFKFKHQRELLSHYENTFLENFDFIIFALNNETAQTTLFSSFIAFFTPEFSKGAIRGDNVAEAAQIKIDDENNTDLTLAVGDLNAEIGLRLADTVERFIITISKLGVTETTGS